jgi:hypothetical protein
LIGFKADADSLTAVRLTPCMLNQLTDGGRLIGLNHRLELLFGNDLLCAPEHYPRDAKLFR